MSGNAAPEARGSVAHRGRGGVTLAAIVALVVLAASAVGVSTVIRTLGAHLRKLPIESISGLKFPSLPESFPGWRMVKDDIMSAEGVAELGTENYISRWYERVDEKGNPTDPPMAVQLHCAYYTGMIDTVPHVPERCMIGGGMEYAGETVTQPVPLDFERFSKDPDFQDHPRAPVWTARNNRVTSRVRLPFGVQDLSMKITPFRNAAASQKLFAGYFFMANGGVVASANDVRLLAFNLKDDYAYYAKIQFMSPSVGSAEELAKVAGGMLTELFPDLMQRVPDWIMVEEGLHPADNPRRLSASGAPAPK